MITIHGEVNRLAKFGPAIQYHPKERIERSDLRSRKPYHMGLKLRQACYPSASARCLVRCNRHSRGVAGLAGKRRVTGVVWCEPPSNYLWFRAFVQIGQAYQAAEDKVDRNDSASCLVEATKVCSHDVETPASCRNTRCNIEYPVEKSHYTTSRGRRVVTWERSLDSGLSCSHHLANLHNIVRLRRAATPAKMLAPMP